MRSLVTARRHFATSRRACFSVSSKPAVAADRLDGGIDGFLGERPMIPQVHRAPRADRRARSAPPRAARRRGRGCATRAAADPSARARCARTFSCRRRNGRQPREVAALDRARPDPGGSMPDSTASASFGPDAADADQALEQIEFERVANLVAAPAHPRARAYARAARPRRPASPRP